MLAPHKNFLESYGAGFVADSSGSFEFIAVDKKDWQKARELLFSAEAQFVQTNTGDVICYSLPTITLSRRNLLTLLSKLEQPNMPARSSSRVARSSRSRPTSSTTRAESLVGRTTSRKRSSVTWKPSWPSVSN